MRVRTSFAVPMLLLLFSFVLITNSSTHAASPVSEGNIIVTVTTAMDPVYDALGSGSSNVVAQVNGSLQSSSPSSVELISSFHPSQVNASVVVGGTNEKIQVTVTGGRYGSNYAIDFALPANATRLYVIITASPGGNALLWRYITDVPVVSWSSTLAVNVSYQDYVSLPHGTIFSGLFGFDGSQLPGTSASLIRSTSNSNVYSIPLSSGVRTVLLQSTWFVPASIVVSAVAVVIFALASLNTFANGRVYLAKISTRLVAAKGVPSASVASANSLLGYLTSTVKRLFQPKRLLVLFLLCSVLMVSLGAISGPDPRVHAYIVSAPGSVGQIHGNLVSFEPNLLVITPAQDYSDFEVMTSVADFNLAVISNYPSLAVPSIDGFLLRGLANVPVIVMDNQTDTLLANQVTALYGSKVIHVQNAANLTPREVQLISGTLNENARVSVLGLNLSVTGFKVVLASEAVLSFLLVFLGWAFLGSLASETKFQSDLSHLSTVISSGVFVFLFSEIIYVTTSLLLAYPLSLHAVISGAKDVTAVGLLGFGGGSTPRLVAGVLGVILGIILTEGAPKLEKTDLAIILGIGLFVLSDPLYLGQFAFTGLLLFFGNFSFGSAFVSSQSLKGFIYGIGSALGGSLNSTYLLSAGKMLFFSGLVPFAYLGRMRRTTMVIVALFVALLLGDGGVRVGEMTPLKSVIAVVPGLLVGFSFLILFLGLASAEKYVRGVKGS